MINFNSRFKSKAKYYYKNNEVQMLKIFNKDLTSIKIMVFYKNG